MTSEEIKERGGSIINRALIAVLLIQFFMLRSPLKEDRELSGLITEAEQRLSVERKTLKSQLDYLQTHDLPRLSRHAPWLPVPGESSKARRFKGSVPLSAEHQKILERLTKIDLDLTALAKARPRREFKIPGTDSAINERDIRCFYPAAVAAFITVILGFRRAVTSAGERELKYYAPPYWAAPFLYSERMPFALFAALNSLGIMLLAALGYIYVQFMYRDDVFQTVTTFAFNIAAGLVASAMLVDVVIDLIRRVARGE